MILSITEVTQLKKEAESKLSAQIHFHDGCGGQYFTINNPTDELKRFITDFFNKKGLKAVFTENGEQFTVGRD